MADKQLLLDDVVSKDKYYEKNESFNWGLNWIKNMRSPEIFLINFSIVAIFQGATFTYMIGSLSTLEKRYAFESKISGFILIADNISQIIISPLIGYLGNKYNRPRIMAIGELLAALSCIVFALPYFIYGPVIDMLHNNHSNSSYELCKSFPNAEECNTSTVWTAVFILWMASFLNGIGYTAFYTIGIPYIDDSTSKKNSPLYLSASCALRLLGPALGLMLSSQSLKLYENPRIQTNIMLTDPRWIGCWWLGFVLLGLFLIIFSIPLAFYPEIRERQHKRTNIVTTRHQIYDAWNAVKRLSSNPIFVFHVVGITFKLIGYLGYYIFKPKYIESQFRKSSSDANFWIGFLIIPSMAFGTIGSGVFLNKIRPKARNIAFYIFIIELILTISVLYAKTLQCPAPVFLQINSVNGGMDSEGYCKGCHCSSRVFQPVCSPNHLYNYFSPCHAGCSQESGIDINSNKKIFSDCKCDQFGGEVTDGYCPSDCNQFVPYITWVAIVGTISSTSKVGETLITLRCVDREDKTFAIGITGAILAIFAFIPYPIIFGAITDSACKVWKKSCGESGNCWLYDIPKLTEYLHNSSFAFMFIGSLFYLLVVIYANRIPDMFKEEEIHLNSGTLFSNESEKSDYISKES